MPGLAGIISKQQTDICEHHLKKMVVSMRYEDFYHSGVYSNPEMSIYIGWTSHPKSFCDCLPVTNQAKNLIFFFTGEFFNDRWQPSILKKERNENNVNGLFALYEQYGEKVIQKLNGWFSGLLLDIRERKSFLFNDRYGMHRVFIHENKNGFYFSSEAKALLTILPETREFDLKGLGEFLTCGCTLGNKSLYKNVNILPPASLWVFEDGDIKRKTYYFNSKEWLAQERLDEKQFNNILVESFGNISKKYIVGSLPIGVSLTGGLDSRMIMACLNENQGKFPCYTFGSMYRDTFDVQIAREVAKACGQAHYKLVLGEEFLNNIQNYFEKAVFISDGYLGMSGAAELYVNSLARNIAPVRLTGNYGGEVLRGVRTFKCEPYDTVFVKHDLIPYLRKAQATFKQIESTDAITFALFHQAPSQGYGRLAVEKSQVVLRTPFMDNDLVKLIYQAPPDVLKNQKVSVAIISQYYPDLLKIPTDRGLLGDSSMLRNLARRCYYETLFKAEYWSSHGMPDWLATISHFGLNKIIEIGFQGRHKFQHFRLWSQTRFANYFKDIMIQGCREFEEFFNANQLVKMIHEHISGRKNYLNEVDKLLTLILARRTLFKSES